MVGKQSPPASHITLTYSIRVYQRCAEWPYSSSVDRVPDTAPPLGCRIWLWSVVYNARAKLSWINNAMVGRSHWSLDFLYQSRTAGIAGKKRDSNRRRQAMTVPAFFFLLSASPPAQGAKLLSFPLSSESALRSFIFTKMWMTDTIWKHINLSLNRPRLSSSPVSGVSPSLSALDLYFKTSLHSLLWGPPRFTSPPAPNLGDTLVSIILWLYIQWLTWILWDFTVRHSADWPSQDLSGVVAVAVGALKTSRGTARTQRLREDGQGDGQDTDDIWLWIWVAISERQEIPCHWPHRWVSACDLQGVVWDLSHACEDTTPHPSSDSHNWVSHLAVLSHLCYSQFPLYKVKFHKLLQLYVILDSFLWILS